jgi:lysozyme family protein
MTRFDCCVNFVLDHETEYDSNGNVICEHDEHDPGGDTKFGLDARSHPGVDICALTEAEARQIYYNGEWTKCKCDQLPAGWDLAVFDAAVNLGIGWAIPALQTTVGVRSDGIIGPITIGAVKKAGSDDLERYLQAREAHYRNLNPKLVKRYLRGWLARVADLREPISISMVA